MKIWFISTEWYDRNHYSYINIVEARKFLIYYNSAFTSTHVTV